MVVGFIVTYNVIGYIQRNYRLKVFTACAFVIAENEQAVLDSEGDEEFFYHLQLLVCNKLGWVNPDNHEIIIIQQFLVEAIARHFIPGGVRDQIRESRAIVDQILHWKGD